jgi:ATP-dependent helicase/nuclease subunit B
MTRRLDGLDRELASRIAELASDEPDAPRRAALERSREHLAQLRAFALPIVEQLARLPGRALWGEWLAQLTELAPRVLRQPQPVLQVLAELAPMAAVGPVEIDEVRVVLGERLRSIADEPPAQRYGRVLVTTLDDARGRSLQVVFVPGLAERVFPQRPREDPLLLDTARARLAAGLSTQEERGQREQLLLRLAVGAAERRVYLSYPRVDVVQARPRVSSFYGLDVARAVAGRIPDVEVFQRQADAAVAARLAWPAPLEAEQAIDASEHDLSVLFQLIRSAAAGQERGGAQYLLELNAHLHRSLRARYARWELDHWSAYDCLYRPAAATQRLLEAQRITARPYSPSALQHFAVCPYRFFLSAIQRLAPRAEATALEQLDPLTRGKLVHRVQAETLRSLAGAGALPVTSANLSHAEEVLVGTLAAVSARFYDDFAPPIRHVWDDEVAALRADLVYWLRRLAEQSTAWHPAFFELAFGLEADSARDSHSRSDPVVLPNGMQLRGAVDLVERRADGGALRVTDHKTGVEHGTPGLVIGKGEVLQPVLYGLAVEATFAQPVPEGRLFYCTARGGFTEHIVRLDARARSAALAALETIDQAIGSGFLPPAPREEACGHCEFRIVCGPYEQERWQKRKPVLAALAALRQMP